jgi:phosphate-selective porin OprO/OprP
MRKGTKLKLALLAVASLGLVASSSAFAERDMEIDSRGGIQLGNKAAQGYWFDLTGRIHYDLALYNGDDNDRDGYPSGSHLRRAQVAVQGGVNDNWEYKVEFKVNEANTGSNIVNEAYLAYTACKNMWFAVGQISVPFSLEDWASSNNLPLMETPLPIQAFSPGFGLGLYGEWQYDNMFTFAAALYHPKHGVEQVAGGVTPDDLTRRGSDPLALAGRLTFSPVHTAGEVYHFGVSARTQGVHDKHNAVNFSTRPEVRARSTPALSTNITPNTVEDFQVYGLEAAGQWGPLLVQGEYVRAEVDAASDLDYKGYYVSAAYVLTGEARKYDFASGTFLGVAPQSKRGAWEVAGRYSFVDLRDRGVVGEGTEHDFTLGATWYVNKNVRFMGNYVHARIDRNGLEDHHLNIIGIRSQVNW